jgi:hypothetical protein
MIRKSGNRFSEQIMLKQRDCRSGSAKKCRGINNIVSADARFLP